MTDDAYKEPIERPGEEDGKELEVLAESIAQAGWDDMFAIVHLDKKKTVRIRAGGGAYIAKGPGVLFVAFLPAEAFEEEDENKGTSGTAKAEQYDIKDG